MIMKIILVGCSKLRSFFHKKEVKSEEMTQEQIDAYIKSIAKKFKKTPYPPEVNYRFNIPYDDEDIYLITRGDKPANIETVPPDFKILGSDTEIYIPDRGR